MSITITDPVDRLIQASQTGKSIIKNWEALRFDYIPHTINHRDQEQKEVAQRLIPILKNIRPSNLLVYGKPGTGKTLIIRKVLSQIQNHAVKKDVHIKLVYTNAKHEATLYGLLVSFGRQLGLDNKKIPTTGLSISEVFKRIIAKIQTDSQNVVFVIDEIDHLAHMALKTHKDILYQMTRANELLNSGFLTLVGISNNLAFKDSLDPRVISTLGEEELVFTNYTTSQLALILKERSILAFANISSIQNAALNLCAALAGQEHGDARRAIDTLRVATEIAERLGDSKVNETHIRDAAAKMDERKEMAALRSYPFHEKLLIIAVMRATGATTGEIYLRYRDLCLRTGQKTLTQRRTTQILGEIEMSGMIAGRIVHQGMHGNTKKFKLLISPETVSETFAEDLTLADIL